MDTFHHFLLWLSVYGAIAVFFVYVLLNGDAPRHRNTFISSLHFFFTQSLPSFMYNRILPLLFCGNTNMASRLSVWFGKACELYIMPLIYHALLIGGIYLADIRLFSRISDLDISYHNNNNTCASSRFLCIHFSNQFYVAILPRPVRSILLFYYLLGVALWLLVFVTDPGRLKTSRQWHVHNKLYNPDGLLFLKKQKICITCHMPKPPRSKHCNVCNVCVARFDHHCGWMGTCIGLYNTRFFLAFLAFHVHICVHGALLAAELVRAAVQKLIHEGWIIRSTGERIDRFRFSIAFAAEPTLCVLIMAFALIALVVAAFLTMHIKQVVKNCTTNESAKWDGIKSFEKEYLEKHDGHTTIWAQIRKENEETKIQRQRRRRMKTSSSCCTQSECKKSEGGDNVSDANAKATTTKITCSAPDTASIRNSTTTTTSTTAAVNRRHSKTTTISDSTRLQNSNNDVSSHSNDDDDDDDDNYEYPVDDMTFGSDGRPLHIYNNGTWSNFYEVFLPYSFVSKRLSHLPQPHSHNT